MTREEILAQQVKELEKLLTIKEAIIQTLEEQLEKRKYQDMFQPLGPQIVPFLKPINHNPDPCPNDNGYHAYPSPWMSISPPSCTKCGKQANSWTTTLASGSNSTTTFTAK